MAGAVLALLGGLSLLRRRPLETMLLGVPAVTTLGAMVVLGQPVRPRFFFFMAGAVALCVARGLGVVAARLARDGAAAGRRRGAVVVAATLLFVACWSRRCHATTACQQDFDVAVSWLDARVRDGAVVAVVPPACLPVREDDGHTGRVSSTRPSSIGSLLQETCSSSTHSATTSAMRLSPGGSPGSVPS